MCWCIGRSLAVLVGIVALSIPFLGVLDSPTPFAEITVPDLTVAYLKHKGPFSDIPTLLADSKRMIQEIEEISGVKNIATHGFGAYFDDPKKVEGQNYRYWMGYVINPEAKNVVEATKVRPSEHGLQLEVLSIPSFRGIESNFNWLHMFSPMIGPFKVYPKLHEHLDENNLDLAPLPIELYDTEAGVIRYISYVKNRDDSTEYEIEKILKYE